MGDEAGAEATGLPGWLARREGRGEKGELLAASLLLQVSQEWWRLLPNLWGHMHPSTCLIHR